MKTVVITGSTRGLGYGLADSFLSLGWAVTISGRTAARVEQSIEVLSAKYKPDHIFGQPADVTEFEQVQALWEAASAHFSKIDIWINNAGIGHAQLNFWDQPAVQIKRVVETNILGTMYGSKVALTGMLAQGFGSLYNMEGLGSDGRRVDGLGVYGSTKYGLRYFNRTLVQETKDHPVLIGLLSPGMVVTDLLTEQYQDQPEEWARAKRIFNILADRVETVAPWLTKKMVANTKSGVKITWLTRRKIIGRFLMAGFRKRELFDG